MKEKKRLIKNPQVMDMKPGRYAWCACGESQKIPFCDGSHGDTGLYPVIEILTEAKKVTWCTCQRTSQRPYCDGSHRSA
jgi:CDGSH iron-sulfur domain-containing protein 3